MSEATQESHGGAATPHSVSSTTEHLYPEFLGTLAHELRNALAPIRISMHVVKLSTSSNPNVDESFAIIERQMRSFIGLIDDIQDVSRLARGMVAMQMGRIALADILEGAVTSSRAQLESAEQKLNFVPPPNHLFIEADYDRLQQVFGKLLQNAAKYSVPGGTVTIDCHFDGNQVTVRVSDTGIGIEPAMLDKVFDLFQQLNDPQALRRGGLGIGLTVARDIVHLHGGTIEAHSEGGGKGSAFVVRLPLVAAEQNK